MKCRLMWDLQRGVSVIPKSVTPSRIENNFDLDGWSLTREEFSEVSAIKTRSKVVTDGWMPIRVFLGDDE
jgi:glycerol 2-dehydrogenase (NADP+)